MFYRLLVPSLLYLSKLVHASTSDPACVSACSDWSVTLGHCRGIYGNLPMYVNYTFVNDFVGCLCRGEEDATILGNDTIKESAGICESCTTTQKLIKENLSDFLRLCAIQKENGTAADALTFRPIGYSTSEAVDGRPADELGLSDGGGATTNSHWKLVWMLVTISILLELL